MKVLRTRGAAVVAVTALTAIWPVLLSPQPAAAADFTFQSAAQAPVFQITEDHAAASFHPEGDGDYNYAEADLGSSGGHALSSVIWPGAAAGHAGSLATLLGAPSQTEALNDPAKAEAGTGTGTEQSSCCPAGTGQMMTASVTSPGQTADSSLDGGGLGKGMSVGSSTSHASVTIDANNLLTATATSAASGINIANVFKVGSVTSSATGTSADGGTPKLVGSTVYNDVQIAGQEAYVDGTGPHIGKPGKPAGSETLGLVNQALKNFGMTIYYTDAASIPIGATTYYYAASLLVVWQPPNSGEEMITVSMGGAAVGIAITPGTSLTPFGEETGPTAAIPESTAAPTASLPSDAGALPASPSNSSVPTVGQPTSGPTTAKPLAAVHSGAVGPGPIIVLGLLGIAAAVGAPRVPGLLATAAEPGCELEHMRAAQLRSRQ